MSPMPRDASPACAERGGDDADRVDAGGLALVVGGADGGVALDVLHGPHAGPGGAQDVGHGLVPLEVHEVVVPVIRGAGLARDQPQLAGRGGGLRLADDGRLGGGREAGGDGCRGSGGDAFGEAVLEFEAAAAGADGLLVRDHGARHEGGQLIVPAQLALPLGVEVHQRAPAAGDGQQVAGDLFDAGGEFAVVVDAADGDAVQPAVCGSVAAAVLATALPISTRVPASTAAAATSVSWGRASTTAATLTPAARRSAARA